MLEPLLFHIIQKRHDVKSYFMWIHFSLENPLNHQPCHVIPIDYSRLIDSDTFATDL